MSNLLQNAVAAHQAGNFAEAERLYREVLATQPNQPDAMALLGVVRGVQGAHDEAISLIENAIAIDPKSALFKFHYGNVLMHAQKLPQAAVAFRQAIALQPALPEAHYNLANTLRALGDWAGAISSYKNALAQRNAYPEAYNNLALCYVHEQNFDDALKVAQQAVTLAPTYGDGWVTVCNVAEKVKDYALGLTAGEHAVRLQPRNHFAWFGYGVILNRLDRHEEAIPVYQQALALKPERADIWDNLGQTYQSLNRLEEAEATYRKTIEVAGQAIADEDGREVAEEEYGNRHWHLALMELLRGKYRQGFAHYRSRFKDIGGLKRPDFSRPLWRGEDLTGKTLLVWDEQGFGDTLMLVRYLPILKQRGVRIILSVHKVLQPLFADWHAGADIVITHGTQVPLYDYHASLFDLPHRMGTELDTIPAQIPYLPIPPVAEEIRLPQGTRPKIAVVWGGNPLHGNDARRSVPLAEFAALFAGCNADFYNMNRDKRDGDDALLARYIHVTDLTPRLQNFADAARFIAQMDLVISCDTATAHLAGGLGKPVWVLLPYAPDWRWLTDRDDNPWYPNARLFRQPKIGDWAGAVAAVRGALQVKFPA